MTRACNPISLFLVFCLVNLDFAAETSQTVPAKSDVSAITVFHTSDDPDVARETQIVLQTRDHIAMVWWIPFEFWANSAQKQGNDPEKARRDLKALKDYTIVGIFAAKISSLGSFDYTTPSELQKSVFIRDSEGHDYAALTEVSGDAKNLADLMKPILANAMGRAGENFAMLFFPAHNSRGAAIADEATKGSLTVVAKEIVGEPETIFLWRTPLTSLATPRYCPVGKERVRADWEYCPWHGVKLTPQ